jgi:UDPglucose 6-dehydrogenase
MNRGQAARITSIIEQLNLPEPRRIAVLGLAYKPNTNVVEESQGIAIVRLLLGKRFEVSVFDPVAMEPAKRLLGDGVEYAGNIANCVRGAGAIVLATDWAEFRSVPYQLANSRPRPVILDAWRMLRSSYESDPASYRAVGIENPRREARERLRRFIEDLARPASALEETDKASGARAAAI